MIHEVAGDILLSGAKAIAHGIAPNEHFDSGLALALREQWPAMARDYRHYAQQTHPKPGEIWEWGGAGGVRIFNLLTQDGSHERGSKPGRASLANVNHALRRLRHELEKGEVASIALPRLGNGVGALDWPPVQELVRQHLGDLAIPVYVYATYHPGQKAAEPN